MKNNSVSLKAAHADRETRAYNWALLATLVLLAALLAQTPARIIGHWLPPSAKSVVTAWGGTVWRGQANLSLPEMQGQLRWSVDFPGLLTLKAGIRWEMDAAMSHLAGRLSREPGGWSLRQVSGSLDPMLLQAIVKSGKFPQEPVQIRTLDLVSRGASWSGSHGEATHGGGQFGYTVNGQTQHLNLPPVVLTLDGGKDRLQLTLVQQQGGDLADFALHDGQVEAHLRQRLLQLSPEYHGAGEPDAVAVSSSQPLNSL